MEWISLIISLSLDYYMTSMMLYPYTNGKIQEQFQVVAQSVTQLCKKKKNCIYTHNL